MTSIGSSRRNLRRTSFGAAAGIAVGAPLQLLISPLIVRRVGLESYGVYGVITSFLAFGVLLDFGIRAQLVRRIAAGVGVDDRARIVQSVREGMTILAIVAVLIVGLGVGLSHVLISLAFPNGTRGATAHPQLLLVCVVALLAMNLMTDGYFTALDGMQRGDIRAAGSIGANILRYVLTLVFIGFSKSAWSLFSAVAIASFLSYGVYIVGMRRVAPFLSPGFARVTRIALVSYMGVSSFLILSQISDIFDFNFDRIIIARYVGTQAAGAYSLGIQLPIGLRSAALLPLGLLVAAVAELRGRDDARLERIFDAVSRITLSAAAVATTGTLVLAPALYRLLIGPGATEAGRAAQLLSLATFLNLISAPWSVYAVGAGWYKEIAWAAGANTVFNSVLSYVLILHLGYAGALIGSICGNAIGSTVLYAGIRRREPRRVRFRTVARPVGVGAVVSGAGLLLAQNHQPATWLDLVLTAALIATVTTLALLAVRAVDLSTIVNLLRRDTVASPASVTRVIDSGSVDTGL